MKLSVRTLCVMLVCVVVQPLAAQDATSQSIEFRRIPEPGKVFHHCIQIQSVGSTQMPPPFPQMKFVQTMEQWIATECKQINPDGSAVVGMTIERLAMRMNAPIVGQIEMDTLHPSTQPINNPVLNTISKLLGSLVGAKVTMDVDPQGHPTHVEGMRKALQAVQGSLAENGAGSQDARMMKQAMDALGGAFDDDNITQQMSCYALMLPKENRPYQVGEGWDNQMEMDLSMLGLSYTTQGKYELQGIETVHERPLAKIRMKESFQMAPRKAAAKGKTPAGGNMLAVLLQQMDMHLSASGSEGVAYWDYQQGILTQMQQTQRMTIEGTLPTTQPAAEQGAEQANGPKFTQRFTTSIRIDMVSNANDPIPLRAEPGNTAPAHPRSNQTERKPTAPRGPNPQ